MTEDPRQTRRNGSDPRTAQSRSARSGGGLLVTPCLDNLVALAAVKAGASKVGGLASQERQQVCVELILVGIREAVRRARIVDFLDVLDEPR